MNINIDDCAKAELRAEAAGAAASGTTEGLPDIVLIQDYGAQKYLQSFPGAFEPLSGKIDMAQFAPYKVAARHGRRQVLLAALRLRRHRPLLPLRLLRRRPASTRADLQDITWDQLIEIGKAVKEKTGHELFGIDTTKSAGSA